MADQPYIPDPFASIGGGVYKNGGWIPKGMAGPEDQAAAPAGPTEPAAAPAAAPASPATAPTSPDPFASLGGGTYANGGWTPPGMTAQAPAPVAGPASPSPTVPAPAAGPGPDPFASLGGGTPTANGGYLPPGMSLPTGGFTVPMTGLTETPAGQTPGTGQPAPGVPLATNSTQIQTPFYSMLSGLLQRPMTVDANDPNVKASLNASRAEEERNFAKQRGMLAERAAAEGTNMSGGFDTQLGNLRAGIGARQGQLAADLTQKAQTDRMAQIMSALSIGQGTMSDSDRNQLQRELADLDASLRREGYDVSREQIGASTQQSQAEDALRRYIADQSTGLNYAQLGQQGTQFGQQLSATTGMHDQDLAQSMLIALLQGGGGG